jgi:hypothetical protein
MPRLIFLAILGLAACGADGAPEPPAKSGLSGEVAVGVVLK